MPVGYRYVIRTGATIEALCTMALRDDAEATLFGGEIIRDLMENAATRYATCIMDISQGERVVTNIAFCPEGMALGIIDRAGTGAH